MTNKKLRALLAPHAPHVARKPAPRDSKRRDPLHDTIAALSPSREEFDELAHIGVGTGAMFVEPWHDALKTIEARRASRPAPKPQQIGSQAAASARTRKKDKDHAVIRTRLLEVHGRVKHVTGFKSTRVYEVKKQMLAENPRVFQTPRVRVIKKSR